MTSIISVNISEDLLQFEGQTKAKLGTPEARVVVDNLISEQLAYFLDENKELTNNLIKKMIKCCSCQRRGKVSKNRQESVKETKDERALSGKLAVAQSKILILKNYFGRR